MHPLASVSMHSSERREVPKPQGPPRQQQSPYRGSSFDPDKTAPTNGLCVDPNIRRRQTAARVRRLEGSAPSEVSWVVADAGEGTSCGELSSGCFRLAA
jgi:hypothetical protein